MFFFHLTVINIKCYHNKYLLSLWLISSIILYNHFVSDILSSFVSIKEEYIQSFEQLIERSDINILVVRGSNANNILIKVNKL